MYSMEFFFLFFFLQFVKSPEEYSPKNTSREHPREHLQKNTLESISPEERPRRHILKGILSNNISIIRNEKKKKENWKIVC